MDTILGITAEYDPFHSGHAYQLERAREQIRPEAVVCAMSGNFTQRGEPAVLDKWTRARIAVQQGVDLVLEIPFIYACNRAEQFAGGAVDLLVSAGVSHISFGCEAQQPEDLQQLVDGQLAMGAQAEEMTRDFMKAGYSRAKAAELTSRRLFGDELTDLMLMPNNILALEYLKRIRWWEESGGAKIRTVPIQRYGSGYRTSNPGQGYAGGSALRRMLAAGQDIDAYLSYERQRLSWVDLPAAQQRLYDHVRCILLRSTPQDLARIYCVGEGMENRLQREAKQQESFESFLTAMVSRRYTAAAIRRIMIYILMNLEEIPVSPPYARVLAANAAGRKLLREIEEDQRLTVITNSNHLTGVVEPVRQALQLDSRASDLFHLITKRSVDAACDARQHPYIE